MGAPRVLQALAKDKLYPLIHVFEKGKKIIISFSFFNSINYPIIISFLFSYIKVMELIKIPSEDIFWSFAFRWDVF